MYVVVDVRSVYQDDAVHYAHCAEGCECCVCVLSPSECLVLCS